MAQDNDQARALGEQAGEASRGLLPLLGDAIEGLWDGLWLNTPDGSGPGDSGEVYRTAYEIGSAVPDLIMTVWDFLTGFVAGLFG